jgi:gamma-glutamyltranspeptidase
MSSMVLREGRPWILFGAVGGDVQPQAHVQVLTNVIDFGMNIQEAIEFPRFNMGNEYEPGSLRLTLSEPETVGEVHLEGRFDDSVLDRLQAMGYKPGRSADLPGRPGWSAGYGYAHGIVIDPKSGARFGGADPRWDAYAIGH